MRSNTKQGTGKRSRRGYAYRANIKQLELSKLVWKREEERREKFGDRAMFCVGGKYVPHTQKNSRQKGAQNEKSS